MRSATSAGVTGFRKATPVGLAGGQHARPRRVHLGRIGRVVLVEMAEAHAHVARPPLGEGQPRHGQARLDIGERPPVLDLEPEQQLAVGVERPDDRARAVLLPGQAPDLGRPRLPAAAAPALVQPRADADRLVRVAGRLDEGLDRARRLGVAEQQAVDAGRQAC